jgi:hypothetical protein
LGIVACGSCLFSVLLIAMSFYQGLDLKYVVVGYSCMWQLLIFSTVNSNVILSRT